MSLELEAVNGLGGERNVDLAGLHLRSQRDEVIRGVDGSGVVRGKVLLRARRLLNNRVGQESEVMPIAVLIGIRGSDVDSGTQAEEHRLNGPLELREEDVVGGDGLTVALVAVDTDQREADALNIVDTFLRLIKRNL